MDWIFGVGSKNKNDPQNISQLLGAAVPPPDGGDPNRGGGQAAASAAAGGGANQPPAGASSAYRFDSTALERAAAAAKDLEKSSECLNNANVN